MTMTFSLLRAEFNVERALVLLFRDNVQHHLQAGLARLGYPLVHALGNAAAQVGSVRLSSGSLWAESALAFRQLEAIDTRELAVSARTRAALTGMGKLPPALGTVLYREAGVRVPIQLQGARTIGELMLEFRERLRTLTASGKRSGLVWVDTLLPGAHGVLREPRTGHGG